MTIPKYEFLLRDAAKPSEPKRFTDTLAATGRFWRDERGLLKFKIAAGDYVVVESRQAFMEILRSGDVLELSGDDLDADTAWMWFRARKFSFPRLNPERPYNPPTPAPISRVGYEFVRASRVRR